MSWRARSCARLPRRRRRVERPANRRDGGARHGRFVVAAIINKHDAVNIKTVRRESGQPQ